MRKKYGIRILSAIMAVSIMFSQMPLEQTFAKEVVQSEQSVQGDEIIPEEGEAEREIPEAEGAEKEIPEVEGTEKEIPEAEGTEKEIPEVEGAEKEIPEAEGAEEEIPEAEEAEGIQQEEETLLNYVFVEKPYLIAPDEQNIMASIGTDATVLESAVLQYKNMETGEVFETPAAEITGNTVLFTISHQERLEEAEYQLTGATYVINGKQYTIDFATVGMDIKYGVNKEIETTPDDIVVVEENIPEVEANIVTTNEEGQVLSEQDIQQALQNGVDSVPMVQAFSNFARAASSSKGNLVVVLDPGHDSTHAGAQKNGYGEENLVLKIAKYCKEELEKYSGVTVYMTRTGADCPNGGSSVNAATCNARRVEFAASKNADVFVSFHLNSNGSTSPNGAGVYYPNSNYRPDLGQEGKELAKKIFEKLSEVGLDSWAGGTLIRNSEDNTLYPDGSLADYLGIIRRCKEAGIPAVLIEHAFLSNTGDVNNFLNSDAKLKKLGVADATAIAEYYGLGVNSGNTYKGIDYSAVYDFDYYISKYSDIKMAYGNNPAKALQHFVEFGIKEGRQAKETFQVQSYYNKYKDLRRAYGNDLKSYYLHYIKNGQKEGRTATGVTSIQNCETVYNGLDYSAVYDYNYYTSKYGDIKKAYGINDTSVLKHFVEFGMKEGRQGRSDFNVNTYKNRYVDLRNAYGKDLKSYYVHYIKFGKKEGRTGAGSAELTGGVTKLNGIDYSLVYDYNYYTNKYSDMKKNYAGDDIAALKHFVEFGMKEGRQAKGTFQVQSYYNKYKDLRRAYGNDLKSYYLHYIRNGQKEGRTATGVTNIQNCETVYNGMDYSAVYDYTYYINKYSDIKKAYGINDTSALKHFVEFGIKEGRQGKSNFNVNYYRSNYSDLEAAYGNNLKSYYIHYINFGMKEARIADKQIYTNIMGSSQTNVRQLMAYYNANNSYPAFYNSTDAPNLQTFCQIYLDECKMEGVRAEVAFTQAMKETNFLRYTGDVKIDQYNFAGLGAIGNGEPGNLFKSVRIGIRAQIQHLKAYASTQPLKNPCEDPRFKCVTRGTAPYVEWLGIKENPHGLGWATDKNYGYNIKERMGKLLSY